MIGLAIHKTIGFRVSRDDEAAGVDRSEHAESAYGFADLGQSRFNPFGQHVQAHQVRKLAGQAGQAAAPAQQESLV